ncbi:MAG: glucokinase [Gammaproteobacteria bacterium]|nr:glucokinase [Gammaproteobacteria bacterium]NNC56477.1 glucokinase [Woeseiaceae bacterium]NNL51603.1 glucokinase [Woeseiaceae bacterium]
MNDRCLLIGDIGGTNARFALATTDRPGFHGVLELQCEDFATADDAISHYIATMNVEKPDAVCLAAAGPVVDDTVKITNNHWDISAAATRADFGIEAVRLLNDFTAIAYAIPLLTENEVRSIGRDDQRVLPGEHFNVAILGPGTGLGVAGLCRRGKNLVPVTGEGGHVGFAPETELQTDILTVLRGRFERVSAERLIAGSGVENIYEALATIRGETGTRLSAAQIFAECGDGNLAAEAVGVFFELLGQAAGDLALTLGAVDGVYIAGGIAKRYPERLASSRFRSAFENKGRRRALMERIPTRLITYDQPGLLGAAYCVLELSS